MRKIIDITLPYSADLPAWPGEPSPKLEFLADQRNGDEATVTRIDACVHFATHVDAPMHFIEGGGGVDEMDLDALTGPAQVIHLPGVTSISADDLDAAQIAPGTERLIIKTDNSALWDDMGHDFFEDFVALGADAATWVVDHEVRLVGVDYLSVETYHTTDFKTHTTLLGNRVAVVEGLDLRAVTPGLYDLYCLPMKLVGRDGAPARAILIADN